jgi:hypothetical protein
MGIQVMKSMANSRLLRAIPLKDCLTYVLSLPIHCLALGCTTIGQIEDDVRISQKFRPMTAEQLTNVRVEAAHFTGPDPEDWKPNTRQEASTPRHRDRSPA